MPRGIFRAFRFFLLVLLLGWAGLSAAAGWDKAIIPKGISAIQWRAAHRLAAQASFGPTPALVQEIAVQTPRSWIAAQMDLGPHWQSRYLSGGDASVDRFLGIDRGFCEDQPAECHAEQLSTIPLFRDFTQNALQGKDQLRQRVAFALQSWLVVSNRDVNGTYGFRHYHNGLLSRAFANYRDILEWVTLSPLMGTYLNHANNRKAAPNENFARELMQLFSMGPCALPEDGSPGDGVCTATYDNPTVRSVAQALTGWTYPPGGESGRGCPKPFNCRFLEGAMVPVETEHDTQALSLPAGKALPAGHSARQALDAVLDALMAHPNTSLHISRLLIQNLVTANPSPAYVRRVVRAFRAGRHAGLGTGRAGDLSATVAAVLLDPEARSLPTEATPATLIEPALMVLRSARFLGPALVDPSFNPLRWDALMGEEVFLPPSVFYFFQPDHHAPGTPAGMRAPAFGILTVATAMERLSYLNCLVLWKGCFTKDVRSVDLSAFVEAYAQAGAPEKQAPGEGTVADAWLADALAVRAYGHTLGGSEREALLSAVRVPDATREERVKNMMYLVLASPRFQLAR